MISASKLPLEMKQLSDIIEEKEAESLDYYNALENYFFTFTLSHTPEVTLSASDLPFFTRNSLLAVVGRILIYSLLIYNTF